MRSNRTISAKNIAMKFEINDQYLTSVTVHKKWSMYQNRKELTEDELVKVLKGEDICSSIGSDDHDEFKRLRNQLEEEGYIKTERGWWNGDSVLKDFTLNGAKFKKGEQFPSGAAIRSYVKSRLQRQSQSKPRLTKQGKSSKVESS